MAKYYRTFVFDNSDNTENPINLDHALHAQRGVYILW